MFVENELTAEKLLLQLQDSSVLFEFSDVTVTGSVRSQPLQPGHWYRVLASRYAPMSASSKAAFNG